MGTGSELNPIAANHPLLSVLSKALLCGALIAWRHRYASPIRAFGAIAWSAGAASNLIAIGVM